MIVDIFITVNELCKNVAIWSFAKKHLQIIDKSANFA